MADKEIRDLTNYGAIAVILTATDLLSLAKLKSERQKIKRAEKKPRAFKYCRDR
jgi:hypothetical protein